MAAFSSRIVEKCCKREVCLAVVEHPKSGFLAKKLVLTTFLGGYVAKKKLKNPRKSEPKLGDSNLLNSSMLRIYIIERWILMEMISCPAVVEHRKRRFLGKKVVLTTFLGGYVSKKSWKSDLKVKLIHAKFGVSNRQICQEVNFGLM